jgi:hypothetical protein
MQQTNTANSPSNNAEEQVKKSAIFDYMPWSKKGGQ